MDLNKVCSYWLFGIAICFCTQSGVKAGPLPAATFEEQIGIGTLYAVNPTTYAVGTTLVNDGSDVPLTLNSGSETASGSGSPVGVSATADAGSLLVGTALASLMYYVQVTGPASQYVFIDMDYALASSLQLSPNAIYNGLGGYADANLYVEADGTDFDSSCLNQVGPDIDSCSPNLNGTLLLDVETNTPFYVDLGASASSGGMGLPASASVDPYFYVDPTDADASDYQIVVSDGIVNAPIGVESPTSVPEPFTLSLFGAGLAGTFAMRRRKTKIA